MTLQLNKELFELSIIMIGIEAYKCLTNAVVSEADQYWKVDFRNCRYDEQLTADNFENYLIDLMNGAKS